MGKIGKNKKRKIIKSAKQACANVLRFLLIKVKFTRLEHAAIV